MRAHEFLCVRCNSLVDCTSALQRGCRADAGRPLAEHQRHALIPAMAAPVCAVQAAAESGAASRAQATRRR